MGYRRQKQARRSSERPQQRNGSRTQGTVYRRPRTNRYRERNRSLGIVRGTMPATEPKIPLHFFCKSDRLMAVVAEAAGVHHGRVQLEYRLMPHGLTKTTERYWPVVHLLSSHTRLQLACVRLCPSGMLVRSTLK